ncbi:MAG: hypothetical protein OXN89_10255 [Bryobacterales bacterium]|nr:hypothetical protein [Bryobacterales bacterium]
MNRDDGTIYCIAEAGDSAVEVRPGVALRAVRPLDDLRESLPPTPILLRAV